MVLNKCEYIIVGPVLPSFYPFNPLYLIPTISWGKYLALAKWFTTAQQDFLSFLTENNSLLWLENNNIVAVQTAKEWPKTGYVAQLSWKELQIQMKIYYEQPFHTVTLIHTVVWYIGLYIGT